MNIEQRLAEGASVLWTCAHPDDEFLTGALLARAGVFYRNPVHIVVMTRGAGGNNAVGVEDLAARRVEEMNAVASRLGASVEIHDFWNAPLPFSSFPSRAEIYERWKQQGDPVGVIEAAVRRFRPSIVLTFDPHFGATGHPEHTLVSRLTTTAVAAAASGEGAHRPDVVYHALRCHWLFRAIRQADPRPVDETWDGGLPSVDGKTCQELLVELTRLHETQRADLEPFRKAARLFQTLGLRVVDPYTCELPPDGP